MASDVLEIIGRITENDNGNTTSISTESPKEAGKLFKGLSAGGKVEMPIGSNADHHVLKPASKSTAVKC